MCFLISMAGVVPANADAYHAKPKLVVILVIDQFRGDYLERYRDDFKTLNGFNLFLKRGANFTDCYYDYANTMTAPGHSTIGTGAYTNGHGISLNDWWDLKRSTTHQVSSVEDKHYAIVGDPDSKEVGASPLNELASTLGDEVVLATKATMRATASPGSFDVDQHELAKDTELGPQVASIQSPEFAARLAAAKRK